MNLAYLVVAALLTGLFTALATGLRRGGPWAGILACSPVTPTAALLVAGPGTSGNLLAGMAMVAATLVVLAALRPRRLPQVAWVAILIPLVAVALHAILPWWASGLAAVILSFGWSATPCLRVDAGRLAWPARAAAGVGAIFAVAAVDALAPLWLPLATVLPVLLLASLAVAAWGSPLRAQAVWAGAGPGSMGVLAFILSFHAVAPLGLAWALLAGWVAHISIAAILLRLSWLRNKPEKQPPAINREADDSVSMKMRSLWAAALFAGALLAGCAGTTDDREPAAAQEPSRLEQKVFITMGDSFLADSSGAKGGTFRVSAEKTVGIHIQNDGSMLHEVMFGRGVAYEDGTPDGFEASLFDDVAADVFVYQPAKTEVATEHGLAELEIGAGGEVWIRANFPADMKGEWEIACFVPGHYESGMKATLLIE